MTQAGQSGARGDHSSGTGVGWGQCQKGIGLLSQPANYPHLYPSSSSWRFGSPLSMSEAAPKGVRQVPEPGAQSQPWGPVSPGPTSPAELQPCQLGADAGPARQGPASPTTSMQAQKATKTPEYSSASPVMAAMTAGLRSVGPELKPRPCVHRPPRSLFARPAASPDTPT